MICNVLNTVPPKTAENAVQPGTPALFGRFYYPEVNPSGLDPTKASAAATEAGRLRRRASAALQNKVFDPGR